MKIDGDAPGISVAALGDNGKKNYAIHMVNNGASRNVTIKGLPQKVTSLKMFVTDKDQSMKEEKPVKVIDGKARFVLIKTSYITLLAGVNQ
ncbi:MAG: hypothetical protein KGM16_17705 [Bacteroidota bacterium]|nr:hypothetical protein [Bacteroidota bacterium]